MELSIELTVRIPINGTYINKIPSGKQLYSKDPTPMRGEPYWGSFVFKEPNPHAGSLRRDLSGLCRPKTTEKTRRDQDGLDGMADLK